VTRLLLLVVVLALPGVVRAQDEAVRAQAQAHIDRATELFRAERYHEAIQQFLSANALISLPDHAYFVARCHEELGELEDALEYFEEYLEIADDPRRAGKAKKAVDRLVARLFGRLAVGCTPDTASARIDGIRVGGCPFEKARIRPGRYTLTVEAPEHVSHEERIVVAAGEQVEVEVRLKPVPGSLVGSLRVESDPPGATVLVDRKTLGRTPFGPHGLAEGRHEVRARLEGYEDGLANVPVRAGKTTVARFDLAPRRPGRAGRRGRRPGALAVRSSPSGATVLLDGAVAGQTPVRLKRVAPGEHRLALRLEGYAPWEQALRVSSGRLREVHAVLDPTDLVLDAPPEEAPSWPPEWLQQPTEVWWYAGAVAIGAGLTTLAVVLLVSDDEPPIVPVVDEVRLYEPRP